MSKKLFLVIWATLMLAVLPILAAYGQPTQVEKTGKADVGEVVIGHFGDLSGPTVATNLPFITVVRDYFKWVNEERGGIKGAKGKVKVNVIDADTMYDVSRGKEQWVRLVGKGMDIAYTALGGMAEGLVADTQRDKIPMVGGSVGMKCIWSDYLFIGSHNGMPNVTAAFINLAIQYHKKKGDVQPPYKFGMLAGNVPWTPMLDVGIDKWIASESKPVKWYAEYFPREATDLSAQIARLKSNGVTDIHSAATPEHAVVTIKSCKRLGLKPDDLRIWVDEAQCMGDVIRLGGKELVEGQNAFYWFVPPLLAPELPHPEGLKLAKQIFNKYHPREDFFYAELWTFGFIQCLIMDKAIELTLDKVSPSQLNGENIKVYGLQRIKDFDPMGLADPITLGGTGEVPHGSCGYRGYQAKNGYLYPVTDSIKATQIIPRPEEKK